MKIKLNKLKLLNEMSILVISDEQRAKPVVFSFCLDFLGHNGRVLFYSKKPSAI